MHSSVRRWGPLVLVCALAACGGNGGPAATAPTPAAPVPSSGPAPGPTPSQPACSATLPDLPPTLPARGGTFTVSILIGSGCAWTSLARAEGWARITPDTGRGSAVATLHLAENVQPDSRTLIIAINEQTFRVVQDAMACVYTLISPGLEVGNDAGEVSIVVNTQPTCPWTASTSENWITVSTPSGRGPGTVRLEFKRNTGDMRQGVVAIGTQRATLTQQRGN